MVDEARKSVAISELPVDELILYGSQLGLELSPKMGHGELLRRVRQRQELLLDLDRETLLEIVVWARRPVRASASKEELAKQIASISKMDFHGLGDRGLAALARLRGLSVHAGEPRELTEARIRASEPIWDRIRRRRRSFLASLVSRAVNGGNDAETYRFLPEEGAGASLRGHIEEEGVVGGSTVISLPQAASS